MGLGAAQEAPPTRGKDAPGCAAPGAGGRKTQTLGAEGVLHHVQQGSTLKRSLGLRHLEVDLPGPVVLAESLAHHLGEGLQGQGAEDRVLHDHAEVSSYPSPERSPLEIKCLL
jgi:hypothetical protein